MLTPFPQLRGRGASRYTKSAMADTMPASFTRDEASFRSNGAAEMSKSETGALFGMKDTSMTIHGPRGRQGPPRRIPEGG